MRHAHRIYIIPIESRRPDAVQSLGQYQMPLQNFVIESFAANDFEICRPLDGLNRVVSKCFGRNLSNRSLRHIKVTQASHVFYCRPVFLVQRTLKTYYIYLGQSSKLCNSLFTQLTRSSQINDRDSCFQIHKCQMVNPHLVAAASTSTILRICQRQHMLTRL